ncbi:hypothetical protein CAEBREN_18619 [Caenorhabditis brenneri]|uniref:Lin-15A/B-like domain-containing protein n=1 Tax=Caenorhabditis brenneri TaxID=135651 RepID=G0M7M6_CAEBE|nr:hypothetical protein CAEBREN_18619 [Caenorhabditis brenneri]
MSEDFKDDYAKTVFDRMMLNTLLVEFLRETNIPFVVVHNSKFKAIFRFICPSIQLPSHQDLIKLNVNNYTTFKNWEKVSSSNALTEERLTKVEEWTREELQRGKNPKPRKEQSFAELLQIDLLSGTSSVRGFQGEDNSLWRLPTENGNIHVQYSSEGRDIEYEEEPEEEFNIDNENYGMDMDMMMGHYEDDSEERKPTLEELAMGVFNYEQQPSSSTQNGGLDPMCVPEANFTEKVIKEETVNDYFEEKKPPLESLVMKEPVKTEYPSSMPQKEQMLQDVKTEEVEKEEREENINQGPSPTLVIEDVPGLVKWPCIVCSQRKESSQLRAVAKVDAYFMIHVCTQTGQYSMKYGKEVAQMKQFKVCVSHLSDVYDNAMNFLNIIEPKQDIFPESQKIIDLYHAIKELRDPSYNPKEVHDIGKKNMWPFVNCIRRFFDTYGRHNYVTKEDYASRTDLAHLERNKSRHRPY